ncbi:VOC family protein [Salinibacillus xinjiangensis]|nr:VOC family protein [Salinibacillus xinjiangensis]
MKNLLTGIGVFIPVSNLKQSTKWYENMLGFKLVYSDVPSANTLALADGTITFCLVKTDEKIEQPRFPTNQYGVDHYFNFHTKKVDEIYQQLLDKGANVGDIHEVDGMRGFELYDPDGNRFSVIQ